MKDDHTFKKLEDYSNLNLEGDDLLEDEQYIAEYSVHKTIVKYLEK